MPLPDLPEPNYFKLEQICIRWGCDEDRLVQYCESGMLEIGVILENSAAHQIKESGKESSVLNGFHVLNVSDVRGTLHWGDNPGDEYSCQIKEVYVPLDNDLSPQYDYYDREITFDSTFILDQRHIFSASSLVIEKSERNRFEIKHNMDIIDSNNNENSTLTETQSVNLQEKRELILKGWLAGKNILNTKEQLEYTREKVWSEMNKIDDLVFRPSGEDTINAFFTKAKLCSFKLGKRKG